MKKDDAEFLRQLQNDIRNGNRSGQREPAFWMILDKAERRTEEDGSDRTVYYSTDDYNEFDNVEKAIREVGYQIGELGNLYLDDDEADRLRGELEECGSFEDVYEFAKRNDLGGIDRCFMREYEFLSYATGAFLTREDAEEYLQAKGHNHHPDAKPFALTAWNNSRFGRLWKIIMETDWCEERRKGEEE